MVATEFNNSLDLSKLDGMTLDFMHILPAKWLIIRVSSHEEMDHVHKRTLVDRCIEDVGYRLDFDNNKPIMEFQPIACTQKRSVKTMKFRIISIPPFKAVSSGGDKHSIMRWGISSRRRK
ncbi:hypothetical protein FRY98_12790 [Paenibacillus faecis]|uniref:Uncharacterized protein n=1 Tax=Paenibacillus faecis TaxID=862114 RepID=A0A5D0CUS9_9BACL|nr:hypothetical protein [Paenibacillus faecis]TYA13518.1 hypothetical protein FRY98_12790 [Paenibacillus faecis]